MGLIRHDCPHLSCRTRSSAFVTKASEMFAKASPGVPGKLGAKFSMYAVCQSCHRGVVFEISQSQAETPPAHDINGWEPFSQCFRIVQIYPRMPSAAQVPNLPANVQSAFIEAEQNFTDKRLGSAAMGYRLALERALKVLFPEAKGKLYKRIEDQVGSLPPAMINLLHEVRFLGNDGAHEEEDPTEEDVATGREFVILYFTYVFDLPKRIEGAQAKRQAAKS